MKKILSIALSIILVAAIGYYFYKNSIERKTGENTSIENIKQGNEKTDEEEKQEAAEENKESSQGKAESIKNTKGAEAEETKDNEDIAAVNSDSKNVSNKRVVVVDPGHGNNGNKGKERISPDSNELKIKDPGGAQGVSTNVPEYKVTLQVAVKLKALLEQNNVKVVMTKTQEDESPGNIDRAQVANDINANLEIRIHCDSAESQSAKGASMLVPAPVGYAKDISSVSREYGQIILDNMVTSAGMYNRGVQERSDLTGFNWSKVPIVLVEMGFMSNPNEDNLLSTEEYQNKLAQGLCNGILKALN